MRYRFRTASEQEVEEWLDLMDEDVGEFELYEALLELDHGLSLVVPDALDVIFESELSLRELRERMRGLPGVRTLELV